MTSPLKSAAKPARRSDREVRKEISSIEKTIARLDGEKRSVNGRLLESTDAGEALRLHNELTDLTAQLAAAEERWCKLQEEVEAPAK
jgi:ATP-binding cassette subfamily F protein 3